MPTVPVSSMETSSSRESLDPPLDPPLASPEPMSSEIQRPPSISSNSSCGRHSSFTVPRPSSAPGYLSKKSGTRSSLEKVYSEEKHASSQTNLGQVRRIHEHLSEDEFDDDTDFLEFRLSNDTGIMRAFEDPTSTPQVIRYSKNRGDLRSSEESRLSAQVERPEYMWNSSNHSLDTLSRKSLPEKDREVSSASHGNTDKHEVQPLSEFSHQTIVNSEQQPSELLAAQIPDEGASKSDEEWQDMKTVGSYDIYDDKGRVVVHKNLQEVHENEENGQINAAKGYTRIAVDDDAKSVTSIDENTAYLFDDEDDLSRNPIAQLQMTKELLTDSQKIAYVGLCRIVMNEMAKKIACIKPNRHTTSGLSKTQGSLAMWTQRIMNRLYLHMDLSAEGMYYRYFFPLYSNKNKS